ncbi:MazG-like family protein [Streptomyces achromogenes]|uniref:MazG-like family protein n=1 Tax=Streptomyces achromogenes TaxID=67255 RepID=A0ABZ1KXK3_STRAH
MDAHTWQRIDRLCQWLDEETPSASGSDVRLLRVLKISEEMGEVAEAVHGALGTNPRKGTSHTWEDVEKELIDVAVSTLVALRTITPDAEKLFTTRLDHLVDRVLPERS